MDAKKREIRNLECQLAFREATEEQIAQGQLGTITGRAICFNSESQVLAEDGEYFREIIEPSAATMEFLNTQDIKINMLHMRELTFGRAKRGMSGNLRLSVDAEGVNFEVDVLNCDLGIRAREMTRAGVYDGCSFEFYPGEYEVEKREGDYPVVRHKKFRYITAITCGMDPAYLQTSLSVRELLGMDEAPETPAIEESSEMEEREMMLAAERRKSEAMRRMRHRDIEDIEFYY